MSIGIIGVLTFPIGRYAFTIGRMTDEDDALAEAILAQLNAEIAAAGTNAKALATAIGRPYDSTRNYLTGERRLPLGIFLEMCRGLDVSPDVLIVRARERMPR